MKKTKRVYTKKSEYWDNISKKPASNLNEKISLDFDNCDVLGALVGEDDRLEEFVGSEECEKNSDMNMERRTGRRYNRASNTNGLYELDNIKQLETPFLENKTFSRSGFDKLLDIREMCSLCQKTYFNIAMFRNAIDVMTEFSSTNIILKGGNKESQKFVKNWLKKAQIKPFASEFFREYYRSGNVIILKHETSFTPNGIKKLSEINDTNKGGKEFRDIPIKYTIINPYYVTAELTQGDFVYCKILSKYELDKIRLQNTDEDKRLLESFPTNLKKAILSENYGKDGLPVYIPKTNLSTVFYKKQGYEPFAVPFGFPVLKDINYKIGLKKIDQALSRTMQNVTLLITMGDEKVAPNKRLMKAMQQLFLSQSVARTIVSDWTTKAQFIIPDIKDLISPEKYKIVNEDIKEGLMAMMFGSTEEKFSNQETKTKIFLERLEEGREKFLEEFLQKEIDKICKIVGFKAVPTAKLQNINLKNQNELARVYTRFAELGLLTPTDLFHALETDDLPEESVMLENQEKFLRWRKGGMFNPMVGGSPTTTTPEGEANRKNQKEIAKLNHQNRLTKSSKAEAPQGAPNPNAFNNGRPATASSDHVSGKKIQEIIGEISSFYKDVSGGISKKRGKKIGKDEEGLVDMLAEKIITSFNKEDWESSLEKMMNNGVEFMASETDVFKEVCEIASEHDIGLYEAAILFHSK